MIVSTLNREELRPVVIETALRMFLKDGIDPVRMDDIAAELSISKRTLYEMFTSKENLLVECLEYHNSLMHNLISTEISEGNDVLTVTLKYLELIIAESSKTSTVLFSNLEKYPVLKEKIETRRETIQSNFRDFLELGIRQDVFRDDLCLDVVLRTFTLLSRMICDERARETASVEDLVNSTIVVLFRGIATRKGMEKLDEYRYKFNNRQWKSYLENR